MRLDLTDEEEAALLRELNHIIIENDRYPLLPRIRTLRGIRAKLSSAPPEPPPARAHLHRRNGSPIKERPPRADVLPGMDIRLERQERAPTRLSKLWIDCHLDVDRNA
jgi:hypothetical protein